MQRTFPVPSAGIHPGLVPLLFEDFGIDSVINAGGGVHGHPDGARGGGLAFRQAIDLTLKGDSLADAPSDFPELKKRLICGDTKRRLYTMAKIAVFCDFDGTITEKDNIINIMKHFAPSGWEGIKIKSCSRKFLLKRE